MCKSIIISDGSKRRVESVGFEVSSKEASEAEERGTDAKDKWDGQAADLEQHHHDNEVERDTHEIEDGGARFLGDVAL